MNAVSMRCPTGIGWSALPLFLFLAVTHGANAQGLAVVDATTGANLRITENQIQVSVENQVAVVTATHTFINESDSVVHLDYAFPMPEGGSATSLQWGIGGTWYRANFSPTPQDTTLTEPGESMDPVLVNYLGQTPLFFEIDQPLGVDSVLVVELTYVELLPYEFGRVSFAYPNDLTEMQVAPIDRQSFFFGLTSPRSVEQIDLTSHASTDWFNDGTTAFVSYEAIEDFARVDYRVRYALSLTELGVFGFSTLLPDSLVADDAPPGFFAFVIEPDPSENTATIEKVFTLIVDRSGSMSGDKIVQARNAASFVVEHLNEGDRFNIVDFSSNVEAFKPSHVSVSATSRAEALSYISYFAANGSTNISGAFETSILQFVPEDSLLANIIVFFTDGQATSGITDTPGILQHVASLKQVNEVDPLVFTFGIGSSVDRQLLTQLASENNGLAAFLGADELESRITEFYLRIQNPVVLDTRIAFQPDVITSVYPDPLPGLYKGQQVVVTGRYTEAAPLTITLSGKAFGKDVDYVYERELAAEPVERYQFLTKIWAKQKITNLLVAYYLAEPGSAEAELLQDEIIAVSIGFGIISPFSSFRGGVEDTSGNPTGVEDEAGDVPNASKGDFSLSRAYPNPFRERTTIEMEVFSAVHQTVLIRIHDALGRLIRVLVVEVSGAGTYSVVWDGRSDSGVPVSAGTYVYTVEIGQAVLGGSVVRIR